MCSPAAKPGRGSNLTKSTPTSVPKTGSTPARPALPLGSKNSIKLRILWIFQKMKQFSKPLPPSSPPSPTPPSKGRESCDKCRSSLQGYTESKMLCYWHVRKQFLQKHARTTLPNGEVGGRQQKALVNKMPWFSEPGRRAQRTETAGSKLNSQETTLGTCKPTDWQLLTPSPLGVVHLTTDW